MTRSTLAAETLALTDGCDAAFFIANLTTDITQISLKATSSLPILKVLSKIGLVENVDVNSAPYGLTVYGSI